MKSSPRTPLAVLADLFHRLMVVVGSVVFTASLFLVLPLIQTLNDPPPADLLVQSVDISHLDEADPPPEPEPEKEPEPEEEPPKLEEPAEPLDLDALEWALNPAFSDSWLGGDFAVSLNAAIAETQNVDALFSVAELDRPPRILHRPGIAIDAAARKRAPGAVYVIFIVDERGRVENPIVQSSTDPIFEKWAIQLIRQWKFEPGKRNGRPVRFRMRQEVSFDKE
jgi:protein TonB